ncbi:hypothetical protein R3P38DRAFT_2805922 [Favolaschia claudopus]|uniref:Uncharacterized protein n=1 Tax=Favolaschia claudopus TaxID=2862362 RepID=A0AAV9ZLV1_9AGAR
MLPQLCRGSRAEDQLIAAGSVVSVQRAVVDGTDQRKPLQAKRSHDLSQMSHNVPRDRTQCAESNLDRGAPTSLDTPLSPGSRSTPLPSPPLSHSTPLQLQCCYYSRILLLSILTSPDFNSFTNLSLPQVQISFLPSFKSSSYRCGVLRLDISEMHISIHRADWFNRAFDVRTSASQWEYLLILSLSSTSNCDWSEITFNRLYTFEPLCPLERNFLPKYIGIIVFISLAFNALTDFISSFCFKTSWNVDLLRAEKAAEGGNRVGSAHGDLEIRKAPAALASETCLRLGGRERGIRMRRRNEGRVGELVEANRRVRGKFGRCASDGVERRRRRGCGRERWVEGVRGVGGKASSSGLRESIRRGMDKSWKVEIAAGAACGGLGDCVRIEVPRGGLGRSLGRVIASAERERGIGTIGGGVPVVDVTAGSGANGGSPGDGSGAGGQNDIVSSLVRDIESGSDTSSSSASCPDTSDPPIVPPIPSTRFDSRASGIRALPWLLCAEGGASGRSEHRFRSWPRRTWRSWTASRRWATKARACGYLYQDDGDDTVLVATKASWGRIRDERRRNGWKTGAGSDEGVMVRRLVRIAMRDLHHPSRFEPPSRKPSSEPRVHRGEPIAESVDARGGLKVVASEC